MGDYQMHKVKLFAALGALTLSSLAVAQTHFECGTVSCSVFGSQPITGIDNLVVDGKDFDLTFSTTQSAPFVFSSSAAGSGQPSTGVDAANALDAFYATQKGPQDGEPGIYAKIGGAYVDVFNIVTAYKPTSIPGVDDVDVTEPFIGANPPAGSGIMVEQVSSGFLCAFATCTVWTPVTAPEISPVSAPAGLTLLLGCLAVLRGRRMAQRAA
jgi:hypothetical protein